jgi:prepilin-type processing-associated H-X9-DG protein
VTYTKTYGQLDITTGKVFANLSQLFRARNLGEYISYAYAPYAMVSDNDYLGMMWATHQARPKDSANLVFTTSGALAGGFKQDIYDVFAAAVPPTGSGNQPPTGGTGTVYRAKEGVERFMVTDINNPAGSAKAQSTMALMFDVMSDGNFVFGGGGDGVISFNHVPGGANVLFMDGHVEFLKYPSGVQFGQTGGQFPVTPVVARCNARTIGPGKNFDHTVN